MWDRVSFGIGLGFLVYLLAPKKTWDDNILYVCDFWVANELGNYLVPCFVSTKYVGSHSPLFVFE